MAIDPVKAIFDSAILCVIILIVRLSKKMTARTICAMWMIPIIRMCIPIRAVLNVPQATDIPVLQFWEQLHQFLISEQKILLENYGITHIERIIAAVYILGIIVVLINVIREQKSVKTVLKNATLIGNNIYRNEIDNSSFSVGIIKPVIVIGKRVDATQHKYVVAHEQMHIHNHDNLRRLLVLIICALFWFNPFVWIIRYCIFRDIELRCDETIIAGQNAEYRRAYAMTILNCAFDGGLEGASGFADKIFHKRIERIISFDETKSKRYLLGVVLMSAFAFVGVVRIEAQMDSSVIAENDYVKAILETDKIEYRNSDYINITLTIKNKSDNSIGIKAKQFDDSHKLSAYSWIDNCHEADLIRDYRPVTLWLMPNESVELNMTYEFSEKVEELDKNEYVGVAYLDVVDIDGNNHNMDMRFVIKKRLYKYSHTHVLTTLRM